MKIQHYYSGTDDGQNMIQSMIAINPELVLSLGLIHYPGDIINDDHDTLAECLESGNEFSKYYVGFLATHAPSNAFDVTVHVFSTRFTEQYLRGLNAIVPHIPILFFHSGLLPEGVSGVTGFHEMSVAKKDEWLSQDWMLSDSLDSVVERGMKAKTLREEEPKKRFIASFDAIQAFVMGKVDERR